MRTRRGRRGNALIEFTLVGIPLIFVLISIFEISRGMWVYHTLAYAVKEGTRFTIVKGQNCASGDNACWVTVGRIAQEIQHAGVGLVPDDLTVTMTSLGSTIGPATLRTLLADTTPWPVLNTTTPDAGSAPGQNITISATYPFRSAIALFWPGAGPGMTFASTTFWATSREQIQF